MSTLSNKTLLLKLGILSTFDAFQSSIHLPQEDQFFQVQSYTCFENLNLKFLEAIFPNILSFQKEMIPLHYRTELKIILAILRVNLHE